MVVDTIGSTVTLRVLTKVSDNDRGDFLSYATDYSVTARVDIMDGSESSVATGHLQVGDAIAFFNPEEEDYLTPGNMFNHADRWYKIKNVIPEKIGSTTWFIEVHGKLYADKDESITTTKKITSNAHIRVKHSA